MSKAPIKYDPAAIKPLNPLDVLLCCALGLPGRSNRACPLSSLGGEKPPGAAMVQVSRAGLWLRGKGCTWVWRHGSRLTGLVTATQRSGPKSWEVTHLFLASGGETHLPELLERAAQTAGEHGCERVFLRLRRSDPLVDVARRGGFFPCVPEVLYRGLPPQPGREIQRFSDGTLTSLRERARIDDHDLFRLYNAATPSEVRDATGMTFDRWMSSREHLRGRWHEFVLVRDGAVRGWMRSSRKSRVGQLETAIHPDHEALLLTVVDFGLERLSRARHVYCLVPEYQVAFERILTQKGFQQVEQFLTLVNSLAITAKEKARVRATIASK